MATSPPRTWQRRNESGGSRTCRPKPIRRSVHQRGITKAGCRPTALRPRLSRTKPVGVASLPRPLPEAARNERRHHTWRKTRLAASAARATSRAAFLLARLTALTKGQPLSQPARLGTFKRVFKCPRLGGSTRQRGLALRVASPVSPWVPRERLVAKPVEGQRPHVRMTLDPAGRAYG
jgi:hypothetical protein